jgi:hypothetical protein
VQTNVPISIGTTKAAVARNAFMGAQIINDITALPATAMVPLAVESGWLRDAHARHAAPCRNPVYAAVVAE